MSGEWTRQAQHSHCLHTGSTPAADKCDATSESVLSQDKNISIRSRCFSLAARLISPPGGTAFRMPHTQTPAHTQNTQTMLRLIHNAHYLRCVRQGDHASVVHKQQGQLDIDSGPNPRNHSTGCQRSDCADQAWQRCTARCAHIIWASTQVDKET